MIAIVHFIYSQSVHALALNAGSMDNDAVPYCTSQIYIIALNITSPIRDNNSKYLNMN